MSVGSALPWRDVVALARVQLGLGVLGLVGLGYVVALWDRALPMVEAQGLAWVLVAWTALHVGTMWLNACLDRDEGPVLLGRSAPVPSGLHLPATAALVAAVGLAGQVSGLLGALTLVAAGLSWAYSSPRLRWKAHPVLGPLVNGVGYGVISPAVGVAASGVDLTPRVVVTLALLVPGVLTAYFVAQAFQGPDDAARGYPTYVVRHGAVATVRAAAASWCVVMVGMTALVVAGWWPRLVVGALPVAASVLVGMRAWAREGEALGVDGAVRVSRRMVDTVAAGALLALAANLACELAGLPGAGLCTAGGHPSGQVHPGHPASD